MASRPAALAGGISLQPVVAGILAAFVGFASAFAVVLQGLAAVGATPAQAASGLVAVTLAQGVTAIVLTLRLRLPIAIAWSTPGAALLAATGAHAGGFAAATGAFLVAAALVVVAGLWHGFGRAVAAIPGPLAAAMLAGVLLPLCLAPVRAAAADPALALPIVLAWALGWRFARRWAVPIAVAVTAVVVALATPLPPGLLRGSFPPPLAFVRPAWSLDAVIGIGLPLFLVTMASQNVPGLAVLNANGYRPAIRPLFLGTGTASLLLPFFGGHMVNLAAITAALCAGPEAHPDPARRWSASLAMGVTNIALALVAAAAAAFVAAAPPLLIQAVAGLALLGTLAAALSGALAAEETRVPAIVTFVTTASGVSVAGIGAAFWGLIAGGALWWLERAHRRWS